MDVSIRPSLTRGRTEFTYSGTITRIPEGAAPDLKNKSFRITADVVLQKGNEEGIIVTHGGISAGYALMFESGKPVFHYNFANIEHYNIGGREALKPGRHNVVFDFLHDGGGVGKGGTGTLSVDGKEVARGRIEKTVPFRLSLDETFDVGEDTGTPVSLSYDVPFRFTGTIEKVVVRPGESRLSAGDRKKVRAKEAKIKAD